MNETTSEPGTTEAQNQAQNPDQNPDQPPAGHPSEGHQFNRSRLGAVDALRRSRSDRHIAGVAGGLGRHFNIDPTIIRVALAVLTFFGGAGLVIYATVWLLVPEEGSNEAPIRVSPEPRKILLYSALGIAVLLAVGDSFSGFGWGWPLATVAVVVAIYLVIRDRNRERREGGAMTTTTPTEGGEATAVQTTGEQTDGASAGAPPAWRPPLVPPYTPPRRPRRTGVVWFWPTLALIAIALGSLGIYDVDHRVADGAYPALALAIAGVMLVVGSVVGRPGGLILLGALSSIALSANVVVGGSFGADASQLREEPTTAAAVQGSYSATVGEIVLDLTRVQDPEALAGRTIDLQLRTGHIHVIVPRSLNLEVEADMDFAGGVAVPGDDSGGLDHSVEKYYPGVPSSTAEPLELDIDAKFGQITVEQR